MSPRKANCEFTVTTPTRLGGWEKRKRAASAENNLSIENNASGRPLYGEFVAPAVFLHLRLEPAMQVRADLCRHLATLEYVLAVSVRPRPPSGKLGLHIASGNDEAQRHHRSLGEQLVHGNRGSAQADIQ